MNMKVPRVQYHNFGHILEKPVSPSKMRLWRRCRRAFFLHYICGIKDPSRLKKDASRDIGSAFHQRVDAFWKMKPVIREFDMFFRDLILSDDVEKFITLSEKNERVLAKYLDLFIDVHKKKFEEIGGVFFWSGESELRMNWEGFEGIIDRLTVEKPGEVIVLDYKTGYVPKTLGKDVVRQLHVYVLIARALFASHPKMEIAALSGPDPQFVAKIYWARLGITVPHPPRRRVFREIDLKSRMDELSRMRSDISKLQFFNIPKECISMYRKRPRTCPYIGYCPSKSFYDYTETDWGGIGCLRLGLSAGGRMMSEDLQDSFSKAI